MEMGPLAPTIVLNSGDAMPVLGMGTSSDGSLSHHERKQAILTAIQVGYRHFDTSSAYGSEGFLGEAIQEAIAAGFVMREELFITSKLFCHDCYPEAVLPAIRKSLSTLQLDYLDLYLIHWPARLKEGAGYPPKPDDILPVDLKGVWKAMESCVKQGLAKSIGVSNFASKKIQEIVECAEIPPAVNQVEMHPKWQQTKLRETCNKFNIQVTAWSPLGAPSRPWGAPDILSDPTVKEIAAKHGKTPGQVVLRWELDNGVCVIPKSYNRKRMMENLDVFGWNLTKEDHQKINKFEQKKNINANFFCSPLGPYRTIEDLWDGEI